MGIFDAIDISASGLTAERLRMDVIANNIANVNTTRTAEGGPYRRQRLIFTPRNNDVIFTIPFSGGNIKQFVGKGVKVLGIEKDNSPLKLVYDPGHPDANKQGYVAYPNVNIVNEMVDMITATRAYEANVSVIRSEKNIVMKALEIGRA
jgi:flagellar basal-body rod protein FlgC